MYSALSLRLVAHRGIQRSRNVFIIIIIIIIIISHDEHSNTDTLDVQFQVENCKLNLLAGVREGV